jgi:hypothetical protein
MGEQGCMDYGLYSEFVEIFLIFCQDFSDFLKAVTRPIKEARLLDKGSVLCIGKRLDT